MTAWQAKGPFGHRDSKAWMGNNCIPVSSLRNCEQMGNKQHLLCLYTAPSILHLYVLHHKNYFKKAYYHCQCNYHGLTFTVCILSVFLHLIYHRLS